MLTTPERDAIASAVSRLASCLAEMANCSWSIEYNEHSREHITIKVSSGGLTRQLMVAAQEISLASDKHDFVSSVVREVLSLLQLQIDMRKFRETL